MQDGMLLTSEGPRLLLTTLSAEALGGLEAQLRRDHPDSVVARVRGTHGHTARDLLRELGAALQLPWYYRDNWNSLEECLSCYSIPGRATLVIVSSGEELLKDEPRGMIPLLSIFMAGHAPVRNARGDLEPRPLQLLIQVPPAGVDALQATLRSHGQQATVI